MDTVTINGEILMTNAVEYLIAIWAFCWIWCSLPVVYPIRELILILGLVLVLVVVFSPFFGGHFH